MPKSVQFRILHALGKKGVYQYLGSDIRGKTREQLAYGLAADAEIVSSYDAIRWVPEAEVDPAGRRGREDRAGDPERRQAAAADPPRAVVAAAQGQRSTSSPRSRGSTPTSARRGADARRGVRALPRGGHRRRPAERRLVRRLRDRVPCARQARRDVPARRGRAPDRGGVRRRGARRLGDRRDAARAAAAARRGRRAPAPDRRLRRAPTRSSCTTSTRSPASSIALYERIRA